MRKEKVCELLQPRRQLSHHLEVLKVRSEKSRPPALGQVPVVHVVLVGVRGHLPKMAGEESKDGPVGRRQATQDSSHRLHLSLLVAACAQRTHDVVEYLLNLLTFARRTRGM